MKILAIDPGPVSSAWVLWDGTSLEGKGWEVNDTVRSYCKPEYADLLAVEMIASYGLAVGQDVFRTCLEIGRFADRWETNGSPVGPLLIPRLDIKLHLCHSTRAKDANVRQALIDRFGAPGTKKAPGVLYGVSSHCWAALALGVCAFDRLKVEEAAA